MITDAITTVQKDKNLFPPEAGVLVVIHKKHHSAMNKPPYL